MKKKKKKKIQNKNPTKKGSGDDDVDDDGMINEFDGDFNGIDSGDQVDSISDSETLLGLCPNSNTTNSAVSASID